MGRVPDQEQLIRDLSETAQPEGISLPELVKYQLERWKQNRSVFAEPPMGLTPLPATTEITRMSVSGLSSCLASGAAFAIKNRDLSWFEVIEDDVPADRRAGGELGTRGASDATE